MNLKGKRPVLATGLDIGSSKISAVAARIDQDGALEIISYAHGPSRGVARGVIVDLHGAIDAVSKVLKKLDAKAAGRPGDIYVNVSGSSIKGERSRGMIPLSSRGREVTQFDIDRCVNAASTIRLPFDREVVHRIVQHFSIDDQPSIANPLGLYASRLSCEIYVMTANVNHLQNIYKCVNQSGYDAREAVFTGMADGEAVLDEQDKRGGALLLDIGSSVTEFAFFSEGALYEADAMPIGGSDVKSDCKDSAELVMIVSKAKEKTEGFIKKDVAVNSVTLMGGATLLDGITEVFEGALGCPVGIGVVKNITGDISSLEGIGLASAIGLAKYAQSEYRRRILEKKNVAQHISSRVMDIINNYF